MSDVEKSLESLTVKDHHNTDAVNSEAIGTIVVDEKETGRKTLRPRPSLDPNDPLVRFSK